jgi:hypothetical protein
MRNNNTLKHTTASVSKPKTSIGSANGLQGRIMDSRLEFIRHAHSIKEADQASDRMEDYLEVIYELIQHKSYATSIDIAECLNVSRPSVTKMMRRLHGSSLINYQKYRGINEDIANRDAEEIEHHVHPETLRKLQALVESIKR